MIYRNLTDDQFLDAIEDMARGPWRPFREQDPVGLELYQRFARLLAANSQAAQAIRQVGVLAIAMVTAPGKRDQQLAIVAAGMTWAAATTNDARRAAWAATAAEAGYPGYPGD